MHATDTPPTVQPAFAKRDGVLHCEDVPLPELVARWATPLYVYSKGAVVSRYRELDEALEGVPHLIAYSVKANPNLALLRVLAELGAGADVVSGGELRRARLAGIPGERIVFSGVGKTINELALGLNEDIYAFNVESEGELCALSDLACAMGKRAPIALRINPDIQSPTPHHYTRTGHAATKFGIAAERASHLYAVAAKLPGIRVRGIDVHIGSQIMDVQPFGLALEAVLELAHDLRQDDIPLEFLDLGGGLGIAYQGEEPIAARALAELVVPQVAELGLKLVVEPGRFIVGEAGALLTRVIYVKEGGGKRFVITDAGMNDLIRPSHYDGWHRVEPVETHDRPPGKVDIVGPICETGDFLALDRDIEIPRPGELLAIHTVGAYGFSMASQYNQRPRPAEVLVDGDTATLVRRRETFEDLVAAEVDFG
ncbi:MAG TPA: diaminopimelate decarboxylase [Longimicrobiaceae bacterium]|nr:diaminopimelate decarboxylase [Longimicrobiaceae bacterium]